MTVTDKMMRDLKSLGIKKGGVLMVHSSFRSLKPALKSPEDLIDALLDYLGDSGTLLMPSFSYRFVTKTTPIFNLRQTPTNLGAVPETFRHFPGVIRSVHPTHSVCGKGYHAEEILSQHIRDHTPCGPHSPFALLKAYNGQILFIGCGLSPNTSIHGIEEIIQPDYLFDPPIDYTIQLEHETKKCTYLPHNFKNIKQRYDRIEKYLPSIRKGQILCADAYLLDSVELWHHGLEALKKDPNCFVERAVLDSKGENLGND